MTDTIAITERQLLDGYYGTSERGEHLSSLGAGNRIAWTYRKDDQDGATPVCDRDAASHIVFEQHRFGRLAIREDCNTHAAVAQIASDEAAMWGDRVAVDAALAAA